MDTELSRTQRPGCREKWVPESLSPEGHLPSPAAGSGSRGQGPGSLTFPHQHTGAHLPSRVLTGSGGGRGAGGTGRVGVTFPGTGDLRPVWGNEVMSAAVSLCRRDPHSRVPIGLSRLLPDASFSLRKTPKMTAPQQSCTGPRGAGRVFTRPAGSLGSIHQGRSVSSLGCPPAPDSPSGLGGCGGVGRGPGWETGGQQDKDGDRVVVASKGGVEASVWTLTTWGRGGPVSPDAAESGVASPQAEWKPLSRSGTSAVALAASWPKRAPSREKERAGGRCGCLGEQVHPIKGHQALPREGGHVCSST